MEEVVVVRWITLQKALRDLANSLGALLDRVIAAMRQDLVSGVGNKNRVFPLGGKLVVFGYHRPFIRQYLHVSFTDVDHWFDRESHTGLKRHAGTRISIVQYLWIIVEDTANSMATVFSND